VPRRLKHDSLLAFAIAVCFYCAFMFAKHDPALRDVIPFGVDPYDAVGSLGVIVAALAAVAALVRAFRPDRHRATAAQRGSLVRTNATIAFIVWITLAADAVAMARHPFAWTAAPSRSELIALLAALAIAAFGTAAASARLA